MHVAYVTATYPPETGWGGIGTYVYHMARGMVERGHDVTIICGYREAPAETWEGNLRIVRGIPCSGIEPLQRAEQIAALVEHEVQHHGLDVVEFPEYRGDGIVFQRRNPAFPTVIKLHCPTRLCSIGEGPAWQRPFRWLYVGKRGRAVEKLERESVARAAAVISPSRWLLEVLQKARWRLPRFVLRIPNPFGGWPEESAADVRAHHISTELPDKDYSAPEVLFLGRLARLKGAELIPAILRNIWAQVPGARFDFIGQDTRFSQKETWGQLILRTTAPECRHQLTFRGGVPYLELGPHLERHSIAVFASTLENFPYATMECMWSGLACVIGSRGGAHELAEDGVNAINTSRRADQIARQVVRLLQDHGLRRRIGRSARQHVQSEFALDRITEEMERAYRQAIGTDLTVNSRPLILAS